MDFEERQRINIELRQVMRDGHYTRERSEQLIAWLHVPQHAIANHAGLCLMKLGEPAFRDLYDHISAPGYRIRPLDIWVLATTGPYEVIHPALHKWLADDSEEVRSQAILSLAGILRKRKNEGLDILAEDIQLCLSMMGKFAKTTGAMYVHLRDFKRCMNLN
jgi:hypothetical protein